METSGPPRSWWSPPQAARRRRRSPQPQGIPCECSRARGVGSRGRSPPTPHSSQAGRRRQRCGRRGRRRRPRRRRRQRGPRRDRGAWTGSMRGSSKGCVSSGASLAASPPEGRRARMTRRTGEPPRSPATRASASLRHDHPPGHRVIVGNGHSPSGPRRSRMRTPRARPRRGAAPGRPAMRGRVRPVVLAALIPRSVSGRT